MMPAVPRMWWAILSFGVIVGAVAFARPSSMFHEDGRVKQLGVGRGKTLFSFGVFVGVTAVLCSFAFSVLDAFSRDVGDGTVVTAPQGTEYVDMATRGPYTTGVYGGDGHGLGEHDAGYGHGLGEHDAGHGLGEHDAGYGHGLGEHDAGHGLGEHDAGYGNGLDAPDAGYGHGLEAPDAGYGNDLDAHDGW